MPVRRAVAAASRRNARGIVCSPPPDSFSSKSRKSDAHLDRLVRECTAGTGDFDDTPPAQHPPFYGAVRRGAARLISSVKPSPAITAVLLPPRIQFVVQFLQLLRPHFVSGWPATIRRTKSCRRGSSLRCSCSRSDFLNGIICPTVILG
jgi:hypothetical protein